MIKFQTIAIIIAVIVICRTSYKLFIKPILLNAAANYLKEEQAELDKNYLPEGNDNETISSEEYRRDYPVHHISLKELCSYSDNRNN